MALSLSSKVCSMNLVRSVISAMRIS